MIRALLVVLFCLSAAGPIRAGNVELAPLTSMPGDPVRGRAIVRDTGKASCLICHAMPISEEPDHGGIGPPLAGIGKRATSGELRRRIVDPTILDPATVMPAYHRVDGLHRVLDRHRAEPIYAAQEVEDVVAYLVTLVDDAPLPSPPAAIPETGAARSGTFYLGAATRRLQDDEFLNPGLFAVERGSEIFRRVDGEAGLSCAACHDVGEMRGAATRYPRFDAARGGLVDLPAALDDMRRAKMGAAPLGRESEDMLALSAFIVRQSNGLVRSVAIDGPARPHFEAGRAFFETRRGQLNLSCAQCHDALAGSKLRGDTISQGQIDGFPIHRLMWRSMASVHRMFAWCNSALRAEPFASGSPEYLALELYLAWRGRALPLSGPGVRR
jgi:sulfur-oxidizing protein SoxA